MRSRGHGMGIDAGELGCPSRCTQSNRDEIGQPARKFTLAIVGIAGLERIVVLVTHGPALMLSGVTPKTCHNAIELCQPALAPPVVLALAERLAPAFGNAEIELLDVLVRA